MLNSYLFCNIFWNRKGVTNQFKQATNFLSCDSKELFVQCFVNVFDQIRKYVEGRNQRTGTPADLLYLGRTVRSSHRMCCAISTRNTCVGVYFLKSCRTCFRSAIWKAVTDLCPKQIRSTIFFMCSFHLFMCSFLSVMRSFHLVMRSFHYSLFVFPLFMRCFLCALFMCCFNVLLS